MPKSTKPQKFYAIRKGTETGVFSTWDECKARVHGFPGAEYASFNNAADAGAFVSGTITTTSSGSQDKPQTKGRKRPSMSEAAIDESKYDVVYCDGACKGNGKSGAIAGIGVWWGENDPRNIAERCPGDQTNNRAELIAVIRMLETTPISKKPLLIKTDSKYTINCVETWIKNWTKNGFKTASGVPVKNPFVLRYLSALLKVRGLHGQKVAFEYVKGHSGDKGNDGADAQANMGVLLPPLPERDWAAAEQQAKQQVAEFESTRNLDTVQVVTDDLHKTPPKRRRISSSKTPSTTPPPNSKLARPPHPLTKPASPSRVPPETINLSSFPARTITTSTPGRRKVIFDDRSPTPLKSPSADLKIRKHGDGFFNESPPRLKGRSMFGPVKEIKSIPSIYPSLSGLSDELQSPPSPHKLVSMSVNVEDINFADYADCLADGDDFSF